MGRDLFGEERDSRASSDANWCDEPFLLAVHDDRGERSIRVSETGAFARSVFLPRSQIDVRRTSKTVRGDNANGEIVNLPVAEIRMPEWLAKERGLI